MSVCLWLATCFGLISSTANVAALSINTPNVWSCFSLSGFAVGEINEWQINVDDELCPGDDGHRCGLIFVCFACVFLSTNSIPD